MQIKEEKKNRKILLPAHSNFSNLHQLHSPVTMPQSKKKYIYNSELHNSDATIKTHKLAEETTPHIKINMQGAKNRKKNKKK